jgi:hypothetical protein
LGICLTCSPVFLGIFVLSMDWLYIVSIFYFPYWLFLFDLSLDFILKKVNSSFLFYSYSKLIVLYTSFSFIILLDFGLHELL